VENTEEADNAEEATFFFDETKELMDRKRFMTGHGKERNIFPKGSIREEKNTPFYGILFADEDNMLFPSYTVSYQSFEGGMAFLPTSINPEDVTSPLKLEIGFSFSVM